VVQHTHGTSNGADEVTLSELLDEGTFGKVLLLAAGLSCSCVEARPDAACAEAQHSTSRFACSLVCFPRYAV
jgi:hypothetical protein